MPPRSGNLHYRNVPSMYRKQYPMELEAIYGSDYQSSYGTRDTYGRGSASQSRGYTESSRPREDPEPRGDSSRNPDGVHAHPAGLYSLYGGKRKSRRRRKRRSSRSYSCCIVM